MMAPYEKIPRTAEFLGDIFTTEKIRREVEVGGAHQEITIFGWGPAFCKVPGDS